MLKFHFSIRTRSGQKIDTIAIIETDRDAAEHKLRQMYRQCAILHCEVWQKLAGEKQWQVAPTEDALTAAAK
ncbi:hypothetical protein D3870_00655 [Noviherbaspirillum cavernae]|uniref:Uncharacterized protein n=1 Tax=Noviherbaspirillum cavernae TaxID=2320862 RepID=A0A418WWW9_9BURK|nr:hypothetical protein [Noviherbaspirillum cavernae]RJG04724.1 hypothetical protein D3870_00655 [Noviherbaspirillum cavernae]